MQYMGKTSVFLPEFVMMPTTIQPVMNVAHPAFHILNVMRETHPYDFVKSNKMDGRQPRKSGNKNINFICADVIP